ncbi:MAG: hypothetical protein ACRD3P_03245 [Terriglobales bacterium]
MSKLRHDRLPNGRKVVWVGGGTLQLALAEGGGHIAALRSEHCDESSNPYWQPPWPSLEPSAVTPEIVNEQYGGRPEGRLLASILGHSLALDLYGAPSKEEAAAGAVTHGQVGVQPWTWRVNGANNVVGECDDSLGQFRFSRSIKMAGRYGVIEERVKNLSSSDRPICWQQHVSFGPPFCEEGFWANANCDIGTTHPESFGVGASLIPNTETRWPLAPQKDGGQRDYREPLRSDAQANDFSGFRMRPSDELGYFVAGNTRLKFAVFYIWPRSFFPWLGIWDEHHARAGNPWRQNVSVRAFEFGASPYPDSRRNLLSRPRLFDLPTYLVLRADNTLWVRYIMGIFPCISESADLEFSGGAISLVGSRGEVGRMDLPEACASAPREVMNR